MTENCDEFVSRPSRTVVVTTLLVAPPRPRVAPGKALSATAVRLVVSSGPLRRSRQQVRRHCCRYRILYRITLTMCNVETCGPFSVSCC